MREMVPPGALSFHQYLKEAKGLDVEKLTLTKTPISTSYGY
jgi:hypothetical protein